MANKERVVVSVSGGRFSVAIDATTNITHNWDAQVTEYPVEDGADRSDHVRPESKRISISGLVTLAKLSTSEDDELVSPDVFEDSLFAAINNSALWNIDTKYRSYEDYALESFKINNKGSDLDISMSFKEIRKAFITPSERETLNADEILAAAIQKDIDTANAQTSTMETTRKSIEELSSAETSVTDHVKGVFKWFLSDATDTP